MTQGYGDGRVAGGAPRTGPRIDLLIIAAIGGAIAGVLCYSLRAPVDRSLVIGTGTGVALFIALWLYARRGSVADRPFPAPPTGRHTVTRWQLPGFDVLRENPPDLTESARLRLRALLVIALARRGIDFDSEAGRAELGQVAHRLLERRSETRPRRSELTQLLAVVQWEAETMVADNGFPRRTSQQPKGDQQ